MLRAGMELMERVAQPNIGGKQNTEWKTQLTANPKNRLPNPYMSDIDTNSPGPTGPIESLVKTHPP